MTQQNYISAHPLHGAFLAARLQGLTDLISDQGEAFLKDAGLVVPSRAVSTVLLIGERGSISTAEIAQTFEQPHQLVTQRVELLLKVGVIERLPDPDDRRRKFLQLTPLGENQLERLQEYLAQAAQAFAQLFEELGCDLLSITQQATTALERRPLLHRIGAARKELEPLDGDMT